MSNPLTFAIVGYGQAATMLHAALKDQSGVQFHWVVGRVAEGAAEFAAKHIIPYHSTKLEDALADPAVDAVVICTPHDLHYRQAIQSLQAGKHVIVEVPMTMSHREAQDLVNLATDRRLVLSVPHVTRYLTSAVQARTLMTSGQLGRVFQIIYRRLWFQRDIGNLLSRKRSWIDTVSWHHAAHAVDLAMWLLDEPMDCAGALIGHDREHHNPVDLSTNFVTPSGAIVTITMSYNARQEIFDCVVIGERGLLVMEGFGRLRFNGETIVEEDDAMACQREAYRRYAAEVVAGLRGESTPPLLGTEILPTMAQLQRVHDLAVEARSQVH